MAVPSYALIPLIYPNEVDRKISLMELSSGGGYVAGPLFGAILYQLGGYEAPFLFFAGILVICIPVVYKFLNQNLSVHIDKSEANSLLVVVSADSNNVQEEEFEEDTNINFREVFGKWSITLTFMVTIISTFSYMYFEPVQVIHT